ncbi:MAG: DUF302 domain-containing protein [Draconibacterium sp.]
MMIFLVGLFLGVALTITAVFVVVPGKMFIVKESKYGMEQTVSELEKTAGDMKWGVPHKYDLQATLKGKGFDVNPVTVMSLCKPDLANVILGSHDEQLVSALMPCRVAVYENNGKTYVSMLNAKLFSPLLGKKSKSVMAEASNGSETIVSVVTVN